MTSFYQPHVREPVFLAHDGESGPSRSGRRHQPGVRDRLRSRSIFATFLLGAAVAHALVGLGAALIMAVEYNAITWGVDGWRDDTFSAVFLFAVWGLVRLHRASVVHERRRRRLSLRARA